ncbi:hypothetical protein [Caloranaerobacter azorensis]|uniref:Uncharacterized protein n=1 Tax=Caloranaerobacter azorensis TaxID=116090 RepID=A0A6P1YDS9_9FIRM|nr:hypothetical protein [Caloranaerobacter azorensis]QIB26913.1 hypothetical protein G3A45_06170 [Caloranaerobacter azorensis]
MPTRVLKTTYKEEILDFKTVQKYRYDTELKYRGIPEVQAPWYVQVAGLFCKKLGIILTSLGVAQAITENYFSSQNATLEDEFWGYQDIEDAMDFGNYDLALIRHKCELIEIIIEGEVAYTGWVITSVPEELAYRKYEDTGWTYVNNQK